MIRKYARVLLALNLSLVAMGLTGCFSSNRKDIEAFLKPQETDVSTETYTLQPPDELEILCSKVPEINLQRQRIRPDGKVSFEALGEVKAAGKTPEELADILEQKAKEQLSVAAKHRPH